MANTRIAYRGAVKVSQRKNGRAKVLKTAHNEGKYGLFNYLVDCLYGDMQVENRPFYLKVWSKSDTTDKSAEEKELTVYPCPTSQKDMIRVSAEDGDASASVSYSFLVTSVNQDAEAFDASGKTYLTKAELLSGSTADKRSCAEVDLTSTDESGDTKYPELIKGYDLILQWKLTIGNADE